MRRLLATAYLLCAATAQGWPGAPPDAGPRAHPAVCRVTVPNRDGASLGSGTLVAADGTYGLVLTNWHVVRDAAGTISVTFPDGFRSTATLLRVDRDWDLAALAVRRPNAQPVPLARDAPQPGEVLTIAGYGKGWYRASSGRCTQYVSPGGSLPYEMVEVEAPAREGDSGGPILNGRGEMAGVLFGTAFGRTTGSYCGRVGRFLAGVTDDFHRLPSDATMLAQRPAAGPAPAAIAGQPPRVAANSTDAATATSRGATPAPAQSPHDSRVASTGAGPVHAPAAVPTSTAPAAIETPGRTEQLKTVLAAVGGILLLFHLMRLLGWAVG